MYINICPCKSLRWCHLLSCPGYSSTIDGHLTELCLTAVKFSRKKGNIVLASRLLSECSDGTQEDKEQDELSQSFRRLTLEGTLGEKWGPELQIEKAKVLRAAGKKETIRTFLQVWVFSMSAAVAQGYRGCPVKALCKHSFFPQASP